VIPEEPDPNAEFSPLIEQRILRGKFRISNGSVEPHWVSFSTILLGSQAGITISAIASTLAAVFWL
jgi:hypothetical protein